MPLTLIEGRVSFTLATVSVWLIIFALTLVMDKLSARVAAAQGGEHEKRLSDTTGSFFWFILIFLVQAFNSMLGIVAPTAYLAVALAVVFLLTGFTACHMNYKELSMVVATVECGDEGLLESFFSDVVFFAPTVFFIVLRPIMNLGMAVIMGHTFSVAVWVLWAFMLPVKGLIASTLCILAILSVFFVKLFTAVLQTYFLFIFSSSMRGFF